MSDTRQFLLTRNVTKAECPWLDQDFEKDDNVYEYTGPTYGCISPKGKAFSMRPNQVPFFELPNDAVEYDHMGTIR
jgi:hypothetical protein